MDTHVNHIICKKVNFSLHNLRRIQNYLDQGATECLVHSLISSHLDYVNSVMYGMSQSVFDKLQRLQNSAARLVWGLRNYDRISQSLKDLHWLPVRACSIHDFALGAQGPTEKGTGLFVRLDCEIPL